MTALVMSLVIPGYCLFLTPGAAVGTYAAVAAAVGSELPPITRTCGSFPKFAMLTVWLLSVGLQAWLCVFVRPRWWAVGILAAQLGIAVAVSGLFMYWHLGIVHVPMIKVLNDFF